MDDKDARVINRDIADVITGARHGFQVGQEYFYIYPATLAKVFKMQQLFDEIGIKSKLLQSLPFFEVYRVAKEKADVCCKMLALYTSPNTRISFFDDETINNRAAFFVENLSCEAIQMLVMYLLTMDKTDKIINYYGIDEERKKVAAIMEVKKKKSKNNLSFCGKSIFGTFIGQLHELGYTDDEILYERPYTFLRLMLADKLTSIYLTDDELQSVPTWAGGTLLMADNPENSQAIEDMLTKRGFVIN